MGVTRRIIFPTIRLILWAVIAAALVKIAFAGADVSTVDTLAAADGRHRRAHRRGVHRDRDQRGHGAGVGDGGRARRRPGHAGRHGLELLAADGAAVAAGTPILEIRQETPQDPIVKTDPETGEQTTTERKPKVTLETVTAPVAGTLTLPTLKDQVVSVGDEVGKVAPGTLSVTGTLTPDQQYRLVGAPTQAGVTLTGGPAPFECTGLRVGAAPTTDTQQVADGSTASSGTVTCAIPAGVTAFPDSGRRSRSPTAPRPTPSSCRSRRCRARCRRGTSGWSPPTAPTRSARSGWG